VAFQCKFYRILTGILSVNTNPDVSFDLNSLSLALSANLTKTNILSTSNWCKLQKSELLRKDRSVFSCIYEFLFLLQSKPGFEMAYSSEF
jgi:hypothetical protein